MEPHGPLPFPQYVAIGTHSVYVRYMLYHNHVTVQSPRHCSIYVSQHKL